MIECIELPKAKLKYWIGELPNIKVNELEMKYSLDTQCNKKTKPIKFALELSLHRHASSYGLIMVDYTPKEGESNLDIILNYVQENKWKYSESMLSEYKDTIFKGILEEYVDYVKRGVTQFISNNKCLQGGKFYIDGANCEVGSSPKLFEILTLMVMEIVSNIDNSEDEQLEDIIKNSFYSSLLFNNHSN